MPDAKWWQKLTLPLARWAKKQWNLVQSFQSKIKQEILSAFSKDHKMIPFALSVFSYSILKKKLCVFFVNVQSLKALSRWNNNERGIHIHVFSSEII
jgi:hypothetical protein